MNGFNTLGRTHRAASLAAVYVLGMCGIASAGGPQVIVDFEQIPHPSVPADDMIIVPTPYAEDGMLVATFCGEIFTSPTSSHSNWRGSKSIAGGNENQRYIIAEAGNGTFDAVSFDISDLNTDDDPDPMDIVGLRADGTVVKLVYLFDIDLDAFETVELTNFTNLVALGIFTRNASTVAQIDNIVIENIVPGAGFPTGPVTFDFEELTLTNLSGLNDYGRMYYKDGYFFIDDDEDTQSAFRFRGPSSLVYPGSNALNVYDQSYEEYPRFIINRMDGRPFVVKSMDVAAFEPGEVDPITFGSPGGSIQHTEPDPDSLTPGFVHYELNSDPDSCQGFRGFPLVRVQLDNIVVSLPCAPDFNAVNGVTVQDIFDFLTAWLAGSPTADFNAVNGVTVQDIFDFLTAWLAGC